MKRQNVCVAFLNKAIRNGLHIIIGIDLLCTGLDLMARKDYFFWPPFMVNFLNDDVIGFVGVLIGTLFLIYSFEDYRLQSQRLNRVILTSAAIFIAFLAMVELGHALFANGFRMLNTFVAQLCMLLLVVYIAFISGGK